MNEWDIYKDYYYQLKKKYELFYGEILNTENLLKEAIENLTTIRSKDAFLTYDEKEDGIEFWLIGIKKEKRKTLEGAKQAYKLIKKVEDIGKPLYLKTFKIEEEILDLALKWGFKVHTQKGKNMYLKKESVL